MTALAKTPSAACFLRLLLLEDSALDAELVLTELRRGGYDVQHIVSCEERTMREALALQPFDLVICDYNLPKFDAVSALRAVRDLALDIPFIVLSGTIGEEKAVEVMRAGAQDYIMKDKMKRLLPAIERELRAAAARREQLRMESALLASERGRAMLLNVLESATDVIVVFRPTLGLLYINPNGRRLLAVPDDAHVAALSFATFHPAWALEQIKAEAMPCAARDGSWAGETALLTGAELEIPVSQVMGCQRDKAGEVEYYFSIMRDLTERKNLQAGLMLADRMASVGVLAASIAHEINNPLTYLDGYVDRAMDSVRAAARGERLDTDDVLTSLAHAKEGVTRVKGIARDLKIFFGRHETLVTEDVPLNDVLDSSLKMAAFETRHRAVIRREYHAPVTVRAHESRLGQVFVNLLINAAHAIEDGEVHRNEIVVRTLPELAGCVAVEIEDSGSGIPPESISRLFEPFYTTKPVGIGTGLGLFVCRNIVTSYGGRIDVRSKPGVGTVFRVTLPVGAAAPATPPYHAPSLPPDVTVMPRGRVLIVDDEPAIVEFLACVLAPTADVSQASGGDQALAIVRRDGPFDVIVSDVMMREGSGVKLYESLALERPGLERRIVFMTGGAPTPEAQRFLEGISNPQVAKPFDIKDLMAQITALARERIPAR